MKTSHTLKFVSFACSIFVVFSFHQNIVQPNVNSKPSSAIQCQSDFSENNKNNFVINLDGGPSLEELSNENLVRIVNLEATDEQCNYLCWKCLGYAENDFDAVLRIFI